MRFILASQSPRRRTLLAYLVKDFEVEPTDVTEIAPRSLAVDQAVEVIAKKKAIATSKRFPDAVVLGADTVVTYRGALIGKAHDPMEARTRLAMLANETHEVVTGLGLAHRGEALDGDACTTQVSFDPMPRSVVDQYITSEAWRGKAGAYGIQDPQLAPYIHIDGSWSNVVGLPLATTAAMLARNDLDHEQPPSESWLRDHNPFDATPR